MLTNSGKFLDRSPDITSAGKLFGLGDQTKDCLISPQRPPTPDQVQKFRCTTQPVAGKTRVFYGRHSDPDVASELSHGVNTKPSYMASQLINPDRKSHFQHRVDHKREESVYASKKRAPLGQSHDQKPGLPEGVGLYDDVYGVPTSHDIDVGELVNPPKSRNQVEEESVRGNDLYKKSHKQYDVGESCDRQYNWSRIPAACRFGIETPHDNRGMNARKSLSWTPEKDLTSKRLEHFRERNTAEVGQVHDPIKETLQIDNDHTHGIMVEPDEYNAGDLIHRMQTDAVNGKQMVKPLDDDYRTSYSLLNGILKKNIANEEKPSGVPTVRSDLPAPRIRRVGDSVNYGDGSDAYGLINPSVYSQRGVYEGDFFKTRDEADIKRIFDSMGVEMSHKTFLELWNIASKTSANGFVSVESFRNVLDRKIAEEYEEGKDGDNVDNNTTLHNTALVC